MLVAGKKDYQIAQSRQSAKRFSSRWNWDSPTPLAVGECAPPPTGGGHTRLRLKGWGSPNSNEGTYTVVSIYISTSCQIVIVRLEKASLVV